MTRIGGFLTNGKIGVVFLLGGTKPNINMLKNFQEALTYDDVLLVPQYSDIESRSTVDLSVSLTKKLQLKLPIIPANMDTVAESEMAVAVAKQGGICFIHRFLTIEQQVREVAKVKKLGLPVGAAVGIKECERERVDALVKAGVDALVVDIAHGHTKMMGEMLVWIKKNFDIAVMAGNVATAEGAAFLISKGADIIKVGVGPGAVCTTRVVTGSGVPQLTALMECVKEARKTRTPVVADGGIYTSGAIVKALAAGASAVMFGKVFASCQEAPGEVITVKGKKYKQYRGMASRSANAERPDKKIAMKGYVPEGVETLVPYVGSVVDVLTEMAGGVRSGLSYSGARNIPELQKKARFVRITTAGQIETGVH